MKDFNRNHTNRPTETEKKVRKVKDHHNEEVCKCFAPFVKLHWRDCPIVKKPCPVHKNFCQTVKEEKPEPEQNVTISFYPSSKTERLFQPVKTLLAHCNPETKINLQYYSPNNLTNKQNIKHQLIQTSPEDLKKTSNDNIFVKKTKSFVTDKTNKMKKLKQCFHSPCNSISQKSRSQTSIREKINEIFYEEAKEARKISFCPTLEKPPDDTSSHNQSFEWFSSNGLGFQNLEKWSDDKRESDFITFTQHAKNNVINHKIFEIKHKKGLNDVSNSGFPKQSTQFVYSSLNVSRPVNETPSYNVQQYDKKNKNFPNKEKPLLEKDTEGEKKDEQLSSSGNSQTSSSGSVYITPFLLMPTGMVENDDGDQLKQSDGLIDQGANKIDEAVQVKDLDVEEKQTTSKEIQTIPLQSDREESPSKEDNKMKSISQQTEVLIQEKYCQCTREIYQRDRETSLESVDEQHNINKNPLVERDISRDSYIKGKWSDVMEKKESTNGTRTMEVQTTFGHQYKEVLITARWEKHLKDEASQTEPWPFQEVHPKDFVSKENKSQMTLPTFANKRVQTSFFESTESSELSKSINMDSSNITMVIKPLDQEESDQGIDKTTKVWWRKSYSDSELYERKKCGCFKAEHGIPLPKTYFCKYSDFSANSSAKESFVHCTCTKIFESNAATYDTSGFSEMHNPAPDRVERVSKAEQTSYKEEDFSAAISDLSELKKIIQEFFEKADFRCKKWDDTSKANKEVKVDSETMTDSPSSIIKPVKAPEKALVNAEVQTSVHVLLDELAEEKPQKSRGQKIKFRQSVLLDDENQTKTFFICALCNREINRFSANAATNTDNADVFPKIKEKTTVVDTEYSEVIKIKTTKRTQNADTSKEPITSSKLSAKQISPKAETYSKMLKSSTDSPRSVQLQKSGIPVPISSGAAQFKPYENLPSTSSRRKSRTQDQRSPTTLHSLRSCICDEIPGPSTRDSPKSCFNLDSPRSSKLKESKTQTKTDIYPSPTKREHPEVQKNQWEKDSSFDKRGIQKSGDRFFYPVLIKRFWPKDFPKTWKSLEKSDDSTLLNSRQKRSFEKESESTPLGKKIKAIFEESPPKECFTYSRPVFSDLLKRRKHEASIKKNTGFIWVPMSSASQVFLKKNTPNQSKGTKSEELVKIAHQPQDPAQINGLAADNSNDMFTVKSCHLNPMTFTNDEKSFRKLFECSFCKSLTFLKTDGDALHPPHLSGMLPYQPEALVGKRNPSSNDDVCKEQVPENYLSLPRENPYQYDEFFEDFSCFPDSTDTQGYIEDNFIEEEEEEDDDEEIIDVSADFYPHLPFHRPELKSQSHTAHAFNKSFYSDTTTTSKSLNTFWFGRDTKETKKVKKYSK